VKVTLYLGSQAPFLSKSRVESVGKKKKKIHKIEKDIEDSLSFFFDSFFLVLVSSILVGRSICNVVIQEFLDQIDVC